MTQSSISLPCFLLHIYNLVHTNGYRISQIPLLTTTWGIRAVAYLKCMLHHVLRGIRPVVYRYDPLMTEVLSNDRTRCQAPWPLSSSNYTSTFAFQGGMKRPQCDSDVRGLSGKLLTCERTLKSVHLPA